MDAGLYLCTNLSAAVAEWLIGLKGQVYKYLLGRHPAGHTHQERRRGCEMAEHGREGWPSLL